jgi:hypothetical protein
MGVGEASREQGVRKYHWEAATVAGTDGTGAFDPDGALTSNIVVSQDHDGYERICRLEAGTTLRAIGGDPDGPDAVVLMAEPNIELGPLRDSRAGQIALDIILTRAHYRGTVIEIWPHGRSCDIVVQLERYTGRQVDDGR